MLQIVSASFGGAIGLYGLDRYREWKRNRPELVISKDWRGRPIVDRKLKLFERAFVWGIVIWTFLVAPYIVYLEWY